MASNDELKIILSMEAAKFEEATKKISGDLTKFTDNMKVKLSELPKAFESIGIKMMATGTAITGLLSLAGKSAEDERVNIARLEAQLKNVGVAYADVREELEANIAATARKTGIADDKQRVALGDLVMITGDYKRALELLPLALDLSAAKQMDLSAAAELVGKVAQGNTDSLARYGIVLGEGATAAEALAAMQKQVGGSAEATASKYDILKNSLDEMKETIGNAINPQLTEMIDRFTKIIDKVSKFIDQNPQVVQEFLRLGIALAAAGAALFAVSKGIALVQMLASPAGMIKVTAALIAFAAAFKGLDGFMEDLKVPETNTPSNDKQNSPPGDDYTVPEGDTPYDQLSPGLQWVYRHMHDVPAMAAGGIVSRPTLAMIGEAGPEAVVPLSSNFGNNTEVHLHIGNFMGDEMSKRSLMRELKNYFAEDLRRTSFGHLNKSYFAGTSSV